MSHRIYYLFVFLPAFFVYDFFAVQQWDLKMVDFQSNSSRALMKVLKILDIEHNSSLDSIVQSTQKAWLRPKDKERWQLDDSGLEQIRQRLEPYLTELGLLREVRPTFECYKYALILGSTLSSTIGRIIFLVQQWRQGLRFETLVLLGCQRCLDHQFESLQYIFNDPYLTQEEKDIVKAHWNEIRTEMDMLQFLFFTMKATESMRKTVALVTINAPNKLNSDGSLSRPSTRDTIDLWLACSPPDGTCLAISDQPHILYQQAVLASCLPPVLPVETVGPAITNDITLAETLDALARLLYQEKMRRDLWSKGKDPHL